MIVITGSSGFLGNAVYKALQNSAVAISITWDCQVYDSVIFPADKQTAIHLAGETDDPRLMFLNNVKLTQASLNKAISAGFKKFIFISSVAVKDLEEGYTSSSYAWSKWACEQMVRQARGIETRILRLPTVYGKGMKCWTIMALKSILRGQNPWNMISLDEAVSRILKEVL